MFVSADAIREDKGTQISNLKDGIKCIKDKYYKVRSQSFDAYYVVENTEIGWICNCPDHIFRGMKCKHIWAIEVSLGMRQQAKPKIVLDLITTIDCPICGSLNFKKDGIRHNKRGDIQKYECLNCGKWFSVNIGFEKMNHNPTAITTAMQLYFSGESLRNTQKSLKLIGTVISHRIVANWIEKYVGIMKTYVDNLKPNVSQTWRAYEVYVKIKGNMKYLFGLMDDETRYWIAQEVADTKYKHDAEYSMKVKRLQIRTLKLL